MIFWSKLILTLMGTLFWAGVTAAQEKRPSIKMLAQPAKIYLGESLRLQFLYDNFDKPVPPDLGYLSPEFETEYLGAQDRSHSMIRIINGNQTKTETRGITYVYRLKPKKAGKIQIEAPAVKEKNQTVKASPIVIEVIPPSEQELVRLEMKSSVDEIYPLIPFSITLNVYVKELPGKYGESDPVLSLNGRVDPTSLYLPWLEDDKLEKGLVPAENWEEWIRKFRNNRGGFIINNIKFSDPLDFGFSFFDSPNRSILFLPQGEKTELPGKDGKKIRYWNYKFERTFRAEKTGELVFDPATLKGIFAAVDAKEGLKAETVYTLSKPVTVKIKDVPVQGRPDNYIGAFGSFDWSASVVPKKVQVGQALTLSLTLRGQGSLLQVKAPDLATIPAVAENFKVYPPTEEISDGKAVFTYSLRAIKEGKLKFPSVPVSYFDVKNEKYVTLNSDPVDLDVQGSSVLSEHSLEVSRPNLFRSGKTLTRSSEGIYADIEDVSELINQKITLVQWLRSLLIPAGAGILIWIFLCVWGSGTIGSFQKKRELFSEARRLLTEGTDLLDRSKSVRSDTSVRQAKGQEDGLNFAGSEDDFAIGAARIRSAFLLLINDCFSKPTEALSEAEINHFLDILKKNNNKNIQLAEKMRTLFSDLDRIRYGHDSAAADSIKSSVSVLFSEWVAKIHSKEFRKTSKAFRGSKKNTISVTMIILSFVFALSILSLTGCSDKPDSETLSNFSQIARLHQEAESAGAASTRSQSAQPEITDGQKKSDTSARQKEIYLKTTALYQGMRNRGTESGAILFNQGNAFYRAGEKAKALACWRLAQRYRPADPYLKANIEQLASSELSGKKSIAEYFMFWQNMIGYSVKYRLAFAGFITAWVFLLLWKIAAVLYKKSPIELDLQLSGGVSQTLTQGNIEHNGSSDTGSRIKSFRRFLRYMTVIAAVFFFMMTCSALYDWNRFDHQKHGIVQSAEAVVRKGNSSRYESVFKETLPELTETVILEERGGWYRIRLTDGQEGWLPESELVVY